MSWIGKLYSTYENCRSLIGKIDADGKTPLLPIAHSTQNAQLEVILDIKGNFRRASIVDKEDAITIIPVTEDSASRSSGIAPHPLFDKLPYVAGDYVKYVEDKKGKEYFEKYIEQLEHWCNSQFSNRKVCAILAYLKKATLISDLIDQKVLVCTEDGKLDKKIKIDAVSQCDAFVRFRVEDVGEIEPDVWLDEEVRDSFIKYYLSLQDGKGLCYASGNIIPISEKHPSKIRNSADKAKLISGNDNSGFTFRGRFDDKNQAVTVGYEISQKAHNALKWLIEKQGYRNYDEIIVAWGTRNEKIPPVPEDTFAFFSEEDKIVPPSTAEQFAKRLNSAIAGYKSDLDNNAEVVVMGLDAATPGRLSITYYRELNGSEFLERLYRWHSTCIWRHNYKTVADGVDNKGKTKYKQVSFIGVPAPRDIAYAAYGPRAADKLVKATVERILPCIVDSARLPYDIVKAAVCRSMNPVSMEWYEWEKVRSITCALVRKFRQDRFKEEWQMELDKSITDTHYLCGRLLAVADEIERWALKEMGEERETNAIRLFDRFAQCPFKTWGVINKRLTPYQARLGKKCDWLLNIREEVSQMLNFNDFYAARNLDGRFILGFDCQKKAIHDEITRRYEERKTQKNQIESVQIGQGE